MTDQTTQILETQRNASGSLTLYTPKLKPIVNSWDNTIERNKKLVLYDDMVMRNIFWERATTKMEALEQTGYWVLLQVAITLLHPISEIFLIAFALHGMQGSMWSVWELIVTCVEFLLGFSLFILILVFFECCCKPWLSRKRKNSVFNDKTQKENIPWWYFPFCLFILMYYIIFVGTLLTSTILDITYVAQNRDCENASSRSCNVAWVLVVVGGASGVGFFIFTIIMGFFMIRWGKKLLKIHKYTIVGNYVKRDRCPNAQIVLEHTQTKGFTHVVTDIVDPLQEEKEKSDSGLLGDML